MELGTWGLLLRITNDEINGNLDKTHKKGGHKNLGDNLTWS